MVIERPISGFNPWDHDTQHRRLSKGALVTISAVAALHLAGAAYLYSMKAPAAPAPVISDPPPITAVTIRLKPDVPQPIDRPQPPKPIHLHDAPPTEFKPPETIPQPPVTPKHEEIATNAPPEFTRQTPTVPDIAPNPPAPKVIRDPNWLAKPTAEQLTQFYPPGALNAELNGQATLDCLVTASGQLTQCSVSGETPRGQRFGEAALKLSRIFRMSPRTVDGAPVEGGTVHIPIHFAVN